MGIEIERKFLVHKPIWSNVVKPKGEYYRQGYLLTDPEKTIRVRVTDSTAFLTIKGKSNTLSRPEFEYEIPKAEANELLNLFAKNIIEKRRYKLRMENKWWEVDEFFGDNEGLLMAEIELGSETEEVVFPEWIGKEVTQDRRYYNSNLSLEPYKNWKHTI
jgi:CYTH domain-containing protein